MADEISGGAGPGPRRGRTALLVLVAAAVVVAGIAGLRRGVEPPEGAPPASPPVVQMPRLPGQVEPAPTGPLPAVPVLALGRVCQPVHTDGRTTLDVSFTLVNSDDRTVTLVRLTPHFPVPGLRGLSTELRSGSCAAAGPTLRTGIVRGHGAVLATLRLGLPRTCPQAIPVEATLTERRPDGRLVTAGVHLLNDLGDVAFTTC
jgi:hypothetical protein